MRSLYAFAWRGVWQRPLRSLLTATAIALGVGIVLAALATNAGVDAAVNRTVAGMLGRGDLVVASFDARGLSAASQAAVAATPGVVATDPSVRRRTFASSPGRPELGTVLLVGIDPAADARMRAYHLTAGRMLGAGATQGVLLPAAWAQQRDLGLGARVSFVGAGGEQTYTVDGLLAADGPALDNAGQVVFVDLSSAQRLFALGTAVDQITVQVDPSVGVAAVERGLESRLTSEPYVLTARGDLESSLRASTGDFQSITILVAAVALFVGGFLIFNTLSMTVTERIREVGLLRAAGATPSQINRLFLAEALLLGIVGSAAGLVLGAAFAYGMAALVQAVGQVTLGAPSLQAPSFALAFGLGLLVTLAAALEPAWRAGRASPVQALKARLEARSGLGARLRWFVVVSVVVAAVGIALWPREATGAAGLTRPFAVYALLLLAALVSPLLLPALGRLAGLPIEALLRAEGRLARSSLLQDRGRSALTLGALMVGLAMVVAVSEVAGSARQAGQQWLASVVPGDYVATAVTPIPTSFAADLAAVPGVASVLPVRTFEIDVGGRAVDAAAIDPQGYAAAGALDVEGADRGAAFAELATGGWCFVPQAQAQLLGLHVGDHLTVTGSGGPVTFRVAAIVARSLPGSSGEAVLFSAADAARLLGIQGANLLAIRAAPHAPADLRSRLAAVAGQYALQIVGRDQIAGAVNASLDRVFGLFDALALVAVIVAALGIVNTLTMDVYERVREIGVLRAAGMTGRQVGRMVVLEAAILGLSGAILGIVIGAIVGAVMLLVSRTAGFAPPVDLPWAAMGLSLVLGVAAATLAAYYPARIASRLPIVRAVRFE